MQLEILTKQEFERWATKLIELISSSAIAATYSSKRTTYSNDEASAYLKVCKKTLQNYRDAGLIKFTQVGRKILYSQEDLDAFISSYKKSLFHKQTIQL